MNAHKDSIFEQSESAVCSYARAFPAVFDRARGSEVWDVDGCRYLDFLAGCGSLNYGHNEPAMKSALLTYIGRDAIAQGLDMHTVAKRAFLRAMREIVFEPRGLDYVVQFTGPTGTNAVEAALKLARKVTGRTNVICFTNGFHGVTTGALAATGSDYNRAAAGVPLYGTMVMPFDGYFGPAIDTIGYLERFLADPSSGVDQPAAVIVEAVQGEGGLNVATAAWLNRLEELCRRRRILLIVDDIQAGCGRTGTFFSFEPADLKPDIVTLSKSLSGYGLPLSVVLIRRSIDHWQPAEHNGTFRGNSHAFVTATVALEHFWRRDGFERSIVAKGEHIEARLQGFVERFSPHLMDVRGRGMMRGVRFRSPKRAKTVARRAFEHGLVIECAGPDDEVLKCLMPLTITPEHLDEGLDIIEVALSEEFARRPTHGVPTAA